MGQLVGGVIGATIGFAVGGPAGAQAGWAIGSAVGGAASQPSQPTPAVGSLAPTEVEYGWTIPRIYSTRRVTAWRLYQSDLEAVSQRVETKGSSSRTVGYRYRCNIGLMICRRGVSAMVRIWRNKELVAVFRTDATEEQIAASLSGRHWQQATFYDGAADQLPHPAYEADKSPDPVPAYRGFCTLWLDGAWCEGRTPPAIEVEVTTGPEEALGLAAWTLTVADAGSYTASPGSIGGTEPTLVPVKSPGRFNFVDGGYIGSSAWPTREAAIANGMAAAPGAIGSTGETLLAGDASPTLTDTTVSGGGVSEQYTVWGTVQIIATGDIVRDGYSFAVSYSTAAVQFEVTPGLAYTHSLVGFDASNNSPGSNAAMFPGQSDVGAVAVEASITGATYTRVTLTSGASSLYERASGYASIRYALRAGLLFFGSASPDARVWRYNVGTTAPTHTVSLDPGASVTGIATDGVTLWVAVGSTIHPLNAADLTSAGATFAAPGSMILCNSAGGLYCYASETLYQRSAGAWVEVLDVSGGLFNQSLMLHPPIYEGGLLLATQSATGAGGFAVWQGIISLPAVTPTGVALNTILSNYWQACGIPSAQIDLTETVGITVDGYEAKGSGAYVTDELATAWFFSVVNNGYGLATRLRGAASVATIAYADLGVGVDQAADEPIEADSDSASETPRRISVSCANGAADHEVVTETDDRILGPNTQTDSISLAMTATPEKTKGIANTIAADRKTAGNTGSFPVGLDWIELELGDVVTVTGRQGETRRVRLVRESFADYVRQFDYVQDRAADLQELGIVTEAGASEPTLTVQTPGAAEVLPVDGPQLRDTDSAPGLYAAVDLKNGADFAAVFSATAESGPYEQRATVEAESPVGTLLTTLKAWDGRYQWDGASTVDVLMSPGAALTASTQTAMHADRSINVALVGSPSRGWELVRFVGATLIATNTYRVSQMLRGLRGTGTLAYAHIPGERFIVVDTSLRALTEDISAVGNLYFKAAAAGQNVSAVPSVAAPFASVRSKPVAPTNLRAERDSSGDATFTWSPRTRSGTRWHGAIFPASDPESYRVEFFVASSFGTAIRTQTVSARSATYTAAQQSADGVVNTARIAVRITPIAANGQLGYPLEAIA